MEIQCTAVVKRCDTVDIVLKYCLKRLCTRRKISFIASITCCNSESWGAPMHLPPRVLPVLLGLLGLQPQRPEHCQRRQAPWLPQVPPLNRTPCKFWELLTISYWDIIFSSPPPPQPGLQAASGLWEGRRAGGDSRHPTTCKHSLT